MSRQRKLVELLVDVFRDSEARRFTSSEWLRRVAEWPAAAVLRALEDERLATLWLDAVRREGTHEALPVELRETLQRAYTLAVAQSLLQERAADRVAQILERAGVSWVFFKGIHLGRVLYADPALRVGADLDVMVSVQQRLAARDALLAEGYRPIGGGGANETHEMGLEGEGAQLDLHWRLLRPGRARRELGEVLLEGRERLGDWWVPGTAATALTLLVHPAITEHVTGPLGRALDLDRWARRFPESIGEGARLAAEAGLGTAAWAMGRWTEGWFGMPLARVQQLAPGAVRRGYLVRALAADPFHAYTRFPRVVGTCFSLPLHDSVRDVARFVGLRLLHRSRMSEDDAAAPGT